MLEMARTLAAANTPVKTGMARRGWKIWTIQSKTSLTGAVYNDVPYIVFLEYGTKNMPPRAMLRNAVEEAKRRLKTQR